MIHLAMWLASGLFLVWFFAIVSHLVWRLIVAMSDSVRTVTRAMFAPIMAAHRATWGWRGPLALGLSLILVSMLTAAAYYFAHDNMFNQHGNPFNLFNPPPGDPYASFSSRLHTYDHNGNSDSGITVTVEDDHSMQWFPNGTPENVILGVMRRLYPRKLGPVDYDPFTPVPIAAPPCKHGAPNCKPWERDWASVEISPGSVIWGCPNGHAYKLMPRPGEDTVTTASALDALKQLGESSCEVRK